MEIIRTAADLTSWSRKMQQQGHKVALVPTMGALHEGHLSLVTLAQQHADKVAVSIFVNPSQFGPSEDFDAYPRTVQEDTQKLEAIGADVLYLPDVKQLYPDGFATSISVSGVSEGLCGAARPGHFDGVATVVTKLLLQSLANVAIFGEKDYQQLQVIRRCVADLNVPAHILAAPTAREVDGLAMSSRNRYLTPPQRKVASLLYKVLGECVLAIRKRPDAVPEILNAAKARLEKEGFTSVDYLELRDVEYFNTQDTFLSPSRLLVAARLGKTRLIDNIAV